MPVVAEERPWLTPTRLAQLVTVVLAAYAVVAVIRALQTIFILLLVSLFLAFALEPAVQWLNQRGWRRGAATALVFVGLMVVGLAVVASIVPLVVGQVAALIRGIPRSIEDVNALLASIPFVDAQLDVSADFEAEIARLAERFGNQIQNVLLGAGRNVLLIATTTLGLVLQGLTVLLVTFYLVADGPRWRRALAAPLPQRRQRELLLIWEVAVSKTGGYIYGRALMASAAVVATTLFLWLVGVPYPIPLGLWVGTTSAFVPVVGTYLGGVLVLLVALTNDPMDALWVLAFIVAYQQVENYLLGPRLQARTLDVHPAVAFVSVLICGALLGAVGALLALPATAIIQALLSTYLHRHEVIAELAVPAEHAEVDESDEEIPAEP